MGYQNCSLEVTCLRLSKGGLDNLLADAVLVHSEIGELHQAIRNVAGEAMASAAIFGGA